MRNLILGLLFLIFVVTISGCQAIKGAATGVAGGVAVGVGGTVYGFSKGLADDAYNTWKTIEKADQWIKDNYW